MLAFAPLDGAVRAAATVLSGLADLLTPLAGAHAAAAAVASRPFCSASRSRR
jgi:hypothetical protein